MPASLFRDRVVVCSLIRDSLRALIPCNWLLCDVWWEVRAAAAHNKKLRLALFVLCELCFWPESTLFNLAVVSARPQRCHTEQSQQGVLDGTWSDAQHTTAISDGRVE